MSVTAPSGGFPSLERAALGPLFSAALFGMAIGAAGLAPLSDQLGRRLLLVAAMFLVGLAGCRQLDCEYGFRHRFCDSSVYFGSWHRRSFSSAPALASVHAESLSESGRVTGGYGLSRRGGASRPHHNALIPDYGWTTVFTAGGILTLVIGIVTWALLPESPSFWRAAPVTDRSERQR